MTTYLSIENLDMVFRKDTEGLWEELLQSSKRIRAGEHPQYALLAH